MESLKLKSPSISTVASGGLFALVLVTATSTTEAQVFFLQGKEAHRGRMVHRERRVTQ